MNILVCSRDGRCSARPDTSLNKENGDFYVPDGCTAVAWSPVVFVRISKAGKAVNAAFAGRYYDSLCFGILLHADCPYADSGIFDHSSVVSTPMTAREDFRKDLSIAVDGREIFSAKSDDPFMDDVALKSAVEEAIVKCSACTSLRTGDFIAVELQEPAVLLREEAGECRTSAFYCGDKTGDIGIYF